MSLSPETRTLLTDALRPPAGYRVEVAAATTYSLDLITVLLAPLTFALQDHSAEIDDVDPIATLESVRRYAERLTIFCQAGAIYPTQYRNVLTFIEDSIVEVTAPRDEALFHPKVWVVRFVDHSGNQHHRCLVLSRNLTHDQSWDTILTLEEQPAGDAGGTIDGDPLGRFVAALPGLAAKPFPRGRRREIGNLASSVSRARFAVPPPYREGEILPLGLRWSEPLTIASSSRLLVVSPFLGAGTLDTLAGSTGELRLLSRPDAIDSIADVDRLSLFVLDGTAEQEADHEDAADASESLESGPATAPAVIPASEATPPGSGLHAKFYVVERGHQAEIVTGSANATSSGFDGNVEVVVRLQGPRSSSGIDSTWESTADAPGLSQFVTPYTPQQPDEDAAGADRNAWAIDRWHATLAHSSVELTLRDVAPDGTAHLALELPEHTPPDGCQTEICPLSLPEEVEHRDLAREIHWGPVSVARVTPFLAVTSRVGRGPRSVRRTRVIKAELIGDIPERRRSALRDIVKNSDDLVRYLLFLLGDPAAMGGEDLSDQLRQGWGPRSGNGASRATIFEPLIRAAADGTDALDRAAALFEELGATTDGLVPDELQELWAVVAETREAGSDT